MEPAVSDAEGKLRQHQKSVPAPGGPFCSHLQSDGSNYTMWKCGRTVSVHLSHGQGLAQPDFWVAASGSPARRQLCGRCRYLCLCSFWAQTQASLIPLAKHRPLRSFCSFPWRRSIGRSQHFAGADNGVWKDRCYLSCRLEAGAPFLSGLRATLGTVCSQLWSLLPHKSLTHNYHHICFLHFFLFS